MVGQPAGCRGTTRRSSELRKEIVLKTMSYASIGSVVMGLLVGTNAAWAAPVQPAHVLLAGVVGQSNGDAASKRSECLDLVSRARQALEDGDLQTCESLLERAEALNVKFSPFYLGDTPKRVRRDLERKRQKEAADSSSTGSETASSPSGDPFARRRSADDAATPGRPRQPRAAPTDQQAPPIAAGENPPVRGRGGNRQPARNAGELLLAARRALARRFEHAPNTYRRALLQPQRLAHVA